MLTDILTAAFIPSKAARFPDPPELHAVWFDSVNTEGPDDGPARIFTHDSTVELYATSIDEGNEAKKRLEAELDARGNRYTTQGWYWLSEIRHYQEVYDFTYIEKTKEEEDPI